MLTEKGYEKVAELAQKPGEDIDPLACFTNTEKAEFEKLLVKLHRYLKANGL